MTPEELSHYREHGYVVQRALFSEDELQVWLDRLGALIRGEAPKSDGMLIMRDVMIAKVDPRRRCGPRPRHAPGGRPTRLA